MKKEFPLWLQVLIIIFSILISVFLLRWFIQTDYSAEDKVWGIGVGLLCLIAVFWFLRIIYWREITERIAYFSLLTISSVSAWKGIFSFGLDDLRIKLSSKEDISINDKIISLVVGSESSSMTNIIFLIAGMLGIVFVIYMKYKRDKGLPSIKGNGLVESAYDCDHVEGNKYGGDHVKGNKYGGDHVKGNKYGK